MPRPTYVSRRPKGTLRPGGARGQVRPVGCMRRLGRSSRLRARRAEATTHRPAPPLPRLLPAPPVGSRRGTSPRAETTGRSPDSSSRATASDSRDSVRGCRRCARACRSPACRPRDQPGLGDTRKAGSRSALRLLRSRSVSRWLRPNEMRLSCRPSSSRPNKPTFNRAPTEGAARSEPPPSGYRCMRGLGGAQRSGPSEHRAMGQRWAGHAMRPLVATEVNASLRHRGSLERGIDLEGAGRAVEVGQ